MLENIFSELSSHMIRGLMIHEQLAQYYWFLGMEDCAKEHECHYIDESKCLSKLNREYILHTDKLIRQQVVENPNIIPLSWYDADRFDVDANTKHNGRKNALIKWREWESETLSMYQGIYSNLISINEIAMAKLIEELICNVNCELKEIKAKFLDLI